MTPLRCAAPGQSRPARNLAALLLIAASPFIATLARADGAVLWDPSGVVLCNTSAYSGDTSMAADDSGGVFVAWVDAQGVQGENWTYSIRVQRVDADGNPLWTSGGVLLSSSARSASDWAPLRVIASTDGGVIVVWVEWYGGFVQPIAVYAQKLTSAGTKAWSSNGVVVCPVSSDQDSPAAASDDSGGVLITWHDDRAGDDEHDIYAQRINASGARAWAQNGVAICVEANDQTYPQIVADDSAGAIITWDDGRDLNDYDIYAQRVNASGTKLWTSAGVPVCRAQEHQYESRILSVGPAQVIVAWVDNRGNEKIFAQMLSSRGQRQWATNGVQVALGTAQQKFPSLTTDGTGGAIFAYVDWQDQLWQVYSQRIDAGGARKWGETGVAVSTGGIPVVTADADGGAIVAFPSFDDPYSSDLLAQRLDGLGAKQWGVDGIVVGLGTRPVVAQDGSGGAIIAWEKLQVQGTPGGDIYAQRVGECPNSSLLNCCEDQAPIVWTGSSGVFSDGSNWNGGIPPDFGDRVQFFGALITPTVSFTSSPTTKDLSVIGNVDATFNLQGRTYTLGEYLRCGQIESRSLTVAGDDGIGSGIGVLTLNGGRLLSDGDAVVGAEPDVAVGVSGTSVLALTGGAELVVDADLDGGDLEIGGKTSSGFSATADVEVLDGQLTTNGNVLLGWSSNSATAIRVNGPNARWLASGQVVFGGAGASAAISVMGKGKMTAQSVQFIQDEFSELFPMVKELIVSGEESQMIATRLKVASDFASDNAYAASQDGGSIRVDTLQITNGLVQVKGPSSLSQLHVALSTVINGGGRLEVMDGLLTVPGLVVLDTLIVVGEHSDGTLSIVNGSLAGTHVAVGQYSDGHGTITVNNGLLGLSGKLSAGSGDGTISIGENGVVSCEAAPLGIGTGSMVTVNVAGASALFQCLGRLTLGAFGGQVALFGGSGGTVQAAATTLAPGSSINFTGVWVGPRPPQAKRDLFGAFGNEGGILFTDTLSVESGGEVAADSLELVAGGVLGGGGDLDAPVINGGTLCPGTDSLVGTFAVASDYVQTATGHLCVTLADSTADQLQVSGSATLGGTLGYDLLPGSTAVNGRRFEVLIAHPVIGTFDSVPSWIGVSYTDTSVVLTHTTVGIEPSDDSRLQVMALEPIQNPVRGEAKIGFSLPVPSNVSLELFDVSGRLVRALLGGQVRPAGRHETVWDGRDGSGQTVQSGVYLLRLEAGGRTDTRRMVLLR
jgi:FlgD Ig-like domain